jgi:hypothetical protein
VASLRAFFQLLLIFCPHHWYIESRVGTNTVVVSATVLVLVLVVRDDLLIAGRQRRKLIHTSVTSLRSLHSS